MTRRGLFGSIAALLAARKLPVKAVTPTNETKSAAAFTWSNRYVKTPMMPASEWSRSVEIPAELLEDRKHPLFWAPAPGFDLDA